VGRVDRLQTGDPSQIGPFRLLGRLGEGGMGRVFLGESPGGRKVAIKVVHPQFGNDPEFRRRFAREVAAARQVGGFHTAAVVGADPDADPPWMATAYIAGSSLAEAIARRGPLDEAEVRQLGAALAEGLAAIHDCGLIHRDLKPGNVILADDGPRIIDFGVAKGADATALTGSSAVIGTLRYMSPEQLSGRELTPHSDVFALGTILAFAATGHDPFEAPTIPAVITRILNDPPDLDPLTGDLRAIIGECLAKDPGSRPSPGDLLARFSGRGTHDPTALAGPRPVPATDPLAAAVASLEPRSAKTGRPARAAAQEPSFESTVNASHVVPRSRANPSAATADHLRIAGQLLEQGEDEAAANAYRSALELNPILASAHAGLGLVLYNLSRYREAEQALRDAIRLDPTSARAYDVLGDALGQTGRYPEAEGAYRESIRLDPTNAEAYGGLGDALANLDRDREAEEAYREAIRLDATNAWAHRGLGGVLVSLGRDPEAEGACREAIRLDPTEAYTHSVLGDALASLGRDPEAEEAYREAIRLDPTEAYFHCGLGSTLASLGRAREAEQAFREAIRLDPTEAGAHRGLGDALISLGRDRVAEGAFREAIRLDPTEAGAHRGLGDALINLGRDRDAEQAYREAIRLDPTEAYFRCDLGSTLVSLGRDREAEQSYREAIRLDPTNALAHGGLGEALRMQRRYYEAKEAYREAIRLDPSDSSSYTGLNEVQRILKQHR